MIHKIIFTILLASLSFSLAANTAFEATVSHATDPDCSNGVITIDNLGGFAPYEFEWTFGNNSGTFSTEQSLSGLSEGQYCLTVTDAACGTATACFEINCQPCFSNDIQTEVGEDFISFNIDDVTGIALPLTITIVETSSGDELNSVSVDGAGPFDLLNLDFQIGEEYCIVYEDADGCTFSDCFIIEGNTCPDDIEIELVQITDPSCGGDNGSIEVNIISDCEQLEVYWDDDASLTGPVLSDATTGQHCVYVRSTSSTDCVDCFAVKCFDVNGEEGDFTTVCTTIKYAAGADCVVEDLDIETESCGETVIVSTGDNGVVCVEVPEGECVALTMPNCELGQECIDMDDVVALREMILWINQGPADSPYAAFLGDANGNGYVSTLDLIYILRYILDIPTTNSPVGDCVLFTPESIEPGPSHTQYSGTPNNEVCDDGTPQEMLLGVIGDGDGSCDCVLNGLVEQEGEIYLEVAKNEKYQYLTFGENFEFYDCVITLSAPNLQSKENVKFTSFDTEAAHMAIDFKGSDVIITMQSKKKTPISLKKGEPFFIVDDPSAVKLNSESKFNMAVDSKLAIRPFASVRDGKKSVEPSTKEIFTVAQNMLLLTDLEIDPTGEIRILAMDGRMLYRQDFDQYEAVDLSPWASQVLVVQYLTADDYYRQVVFSPSNN